MRSLGVMNSKGESDFRRGMEVIVRSNRGLEVGQVLCEATEDALSHLDQPPSGHIVRVVSDDDASQASHIDGARKNKLETCQKHIDELKLDMDLVDVEQLFGGERLIVFYLAEERVDFRELVKRLASEFQTRIEMKQIGVRDEAKLLADFGDCGKPVCCNNHLVTMPPVSMRMAKLQKATLDPTKISGRCGRLKCCLRYEFDHYEAVQKQLPKIGAHVVTRNGRARVLNQQILAEQLLVETEDNRRMLIDASEVLSVIKKSKGDSPARNDAKQGKTENQDEQSAGKNTTRNESTTVVAEPKANSTAEKPNRKRRNNRRRGRNDKKKRNGPEK